MTTLFDELYDNRKCSKCGIVKPIDEYALLRDKRKKYEYYYRSGWCNDCKKAYDRERKKTKEAREYLKKWKEENKEYFKEYQKRKYEIYKTTPLGQSCIIHLKTCKYCNNIFTSRRNKSLYCSTVCENRYRYKEKTPEKKQSDCAKKLRKKYGTAIRRCIECGYEFNMSDIKYKGKINLCSDECSRKHANRLKDKNNRQRARRYGGVYQTINKTKVFEKYKWRCAVCGRKTPKSLIGSINDNAPELDHIIPLSKGGSHTYSNVQCLCRSCNGLKSDKIIDNQQLKLCI